MEEVVLDVGARSGGYLEDVGTAEGKCGHDFIIWIEGVVALTTRVLASGHCSTAATSCTRRHN
jgi:hypothetical protein